MTMRLSPGIRTATIAALLAAWIAPCDAGESYTWLETDPGEYTLACDMASGAGELRLAFDCVDDETLGYVRVQDGKAALWRVAGGQPERVTEPAAIQTGANWRATLQRREGRVRLIAGGRVVIDAEWPGPIAGRTGTLVGGAAKVEDTLVQPYEPPIIVDDFTRDAGETGGWETREGAWKNTMVAAPRAEAAKSANPFTVRAAAAPTALMTTGSWFWDTYRASVSVRPVDCEAVAVAAYVQDAENMVLFRWHAGSDDATKARELVMVREGKETVLASGAGGYVPGHWYRMELNVRPGHVEGLIDRFVAISADTDAFGEGAVGLWCGAGEAVFDDMTVGSPEATELGLPRLNPIFLADETMTANELYTPAGQWRAGNGATWHWGDYAHDVRLSIPVAALPDSPTGVLLAADGTDPGSGYAATLIKAGAEINVTLARQGAPVAEGACAAGESIAVTVTDGTVAVASPGGEAVSFTDPEPLAGRHLGLTGTVDAIVMQAEVTSDHLHDYAFDSAPTDWFGSKGIWQVTTRWPCQPVWTFFGGAHDENPVLWSKHEYKGDVTLEFFGNVKMDAPPPPGYTRPSDVNAALCSDGQDLGSGYAFVFAGWKNTKTAIIRKGQVVAETTDAVFVEPTSSNVNFHRHWFRIRARKMGNRISLSVDGREVLAYEDPEPIASGRAGIWSFHNGLMIGRARLWFDEELP
ncbi:MAG TPA: hypothetical protein QGH10_05060, partial [Armatimonadota bacterium]|nr:hypothetical protein [Armatimonadota bacterium]